MKSPGNWVVPATSPKRNSLNLVSSREHAHFRSAVKDCSTLGGNTKPEGLIVRMRSSLIPVSKHVLIKRVGFVSNAGSSSDFLMPTD